MKKFEWKNIKQRIGKGRKKMIALTVVLCLVIATAGNILSKQGKSKASDNKVISTGVGTGTIQESVSGTGTISYVSSTDIEVPADLEMNEILVSEGTYVEKGTMLATVDATSLAVCIADVEEAISELDSTITSEHTSNTTQYITAGVSGTVEEIYGEAGDDVDDVIVKNGALMLIKNGDEAIKVIGSSGTISSVNVSEGSTVSASTKVFTVDSDSQSGDYLQAVKDREELVSILETLISIRKNGGIVASVEGMVEAVNVTGASEGENASSMDMSSNDGKLTEVNNSDDDEEDNGEIHSIKAVTMTNLASYTTTSNNITLADVSEDKMKILNDIKAGVGRIEGTTKEMEYADKENADEWTECTDDYTEIGNGVWYVRYKATELTTASDAVKVEVTETETNNNESTESDGGSAVADNSKGNDSLSDKSGSGSTSGGASITNTSNNKSGSESTSSNSTNTSTEKSSSDSTGDNGKSVSDSSTWNNSSASSGASSKGGTSSGSSSDKSGSASGSSSSKSGSTSGSSSSKSSSSDSGNSSISMVSAFTISDGDKMKVTMNVDELDILTMKEGLSAEITLDAIENKTFEGTITAVSGSASSSNGSTQYPVEITFDKADEMLSGMNASVAVIIEEAEDVLTVPLVAISDEGRSSYVYTGYDEATGELTGKTEVTLGMSDDNKVEIKEGVSEGDTVYYIMQDSQDSDSKSNGKSDRGGMGGMGIPGMNSQGDMKMGGDRPSGNNGNRPSGDSSGSGKGSGGPGKQ